MTAHYSRCQNCKHAHGEVGKHWCYANPQANGGYRQWIRSETYHEFIVILGCASFEEYSEGHQLVSP
jgi:hypothetical protein